jgi:hypothetical protein
MTIHRHNRQFPCDVTEAGVRRLRDYALRDWLAADPLRHGVRRARNHAILQYYKARRVDRQDELIARLRPVAAGKTAVFTVAFNSSRTIEWQADGFAKYGAGAVLVVCDNSPIEDARKKIEAACLARGVAYVRLPRPPLAALLLTNPPLSHGVALTWIFYNLVRPLAPRVFAFIDHDLIPLSPLDLAERLGDRPVYGLKSDREAFGTWSLWAGYSVFDFAVAGPLPLDFTTDSSLQLDTGGQNWSRLYRFIPPEGLRFADHWSEPVHLDGDDAATAVEMIDGWLHIGGVSYRNDARDRLDIAERVLAHLGANARNSRGRGGSSGPRR